MVDDFARAHSVRADNDRIQSGCERADLAAGVALVAIALIGQHLRLLQRRVAAQAGQGHGAVHRAGIEEAEAEPLRQGARSTRFTGSGGSVDRDDHSFHLASTSTHSWAVKSTRTPSSRGSST